MNLAFVHEQTRLINIAGAVAVLYLRQQQDYTLDG